LATQPIPAPQRRKGFTPFPNDVLLDWPRLLSGNAQIYTVMFLNSETTGAARDAGTKPPYWSRPITTAELAAFGRCTIRSIQLAVDELVDRKVIERKNSVNGSARYHIPFDTWPVLPDRPSNVVPITEAEEPEADTEEDTNPQGEVIPVFSKPQRLRAGLRPRPKELPAAAGKLRVTADSEVEYTGTLCAGVLTLEFKIPKGEQEAKAKRNIFRNADPKSHKTQSGLVNDRPFADFERTARKVGMSFSKADLGPMYTQWLKIATRKEQLEAIQGLIDRQAAGEFSDPTFIPLPQNYLKKRMWERAIRKASGRSGKSADDFVRTVEEAKRIARARRERAGS
jgi:hypothetical protein